MLHFARSVERFLDALLTSLDDPEVEILAVCGASAFPVGASGVRRYDVREHDFSFTGRGNLGRMTGALAAEVRRFRPHLVHAHHFEENLVAAFSSLRRDAPVYVQSRHYTDKVDLYATGELKRLLFHGVEHFSNRRARRIVVPSESVREYLVKKQGVSSSKIEVIPHGFAFSELGASPVDVADLRASHGLEGKFVAMFAGRLIWTKRVEDFLAAAAEAGESCPDLHAVVVGSGPHEGALRQCAAEPRLAGRVTFIPWQPDVIPWLVTSDVLVNPSLSESFSQILVEALAMRVPVIMTPVGVAPEVLGDGRRGRMVPFRSPGRIAEALRELYKNRQLARALGEAGREYVRAEFPAGLVAQRHLAMYRSLAGSHR